ncbi:MAG: glycosyltransferase family 4 protein [Chloroflexi bacterium]|nr:glycosyltransferase family 4 protein [Chloroflexota bacterium]
MKILLLTHYYPPEVGAPQARLSELARHLMRSGHQVAVLAPLPHYPTGVIPEAYRGAWLRREMLDDVPVVRTWVYAVPNRGVAKRLLDHLSFTLSALYGAPFAGRPDVLVVETPPLFLGLTALALSVAWRVPYVMNVADPWLASAVEMGVLRNRLAIALGRALEKLLYTTATRTTTVTRGMYDGFLREGVPKAKLALVTNGVDTSFFRPNAPGAVALRRQLELDGRFVVLYAGTHGLTQGLETVIAAARQLADDGRTLFLFVGEGAEKERLQELATDLPTVRFLPNQPKSTMPSLLAAADACVVPLRDLPLFRGALPSKLFEAMAAGRPLITAVAGEAAALTWQARAGLCVPPERPEELAAAVARLRDDPTLRRALGANGRAYVSVYYARERIAERYEAVLRAAVGA